MSRRTFLELTTGGAAFATYGSIPALVKPEPFSVVKDGRKVHFLVGSQPCWTIDPVFFDGRAKVDLQRKEGALLVSVKDALFPGTSLPAGFSSVIRESDKRWTIAIAMDTGVDLHAEFLPWLLGQQKATGLWRPTALRPLPQLVLDSPGAMQMSFSPDWVLSAQGAGTAVLGKLPQQLEVSGWKLVLNHPDRIAGTVDGRTTTFFLSRGDAHWPLDISRSSDDGWSISHERTANVFDELRVEVVQGSVGPIYSGLLAQAVENAEELHFFPGGGLFASSGESFNFPLTRPRLAFSLMPDEKDSALIADLPSMPLWAHTDALSLMFNSSFEYPHFELRESDDVPQGPSVTPVVSAVQCPADHDCTIQLKFDKPRPTPFTWGKILDPMERLLGYLHLVPWEHAMAFDLSCGDVLTVVRPTDMLKLDFEFQGVRLSAGAFSKIHPSSHGNQKIDPSKAPWVGETTVEPTGANCPPKACLPAPDGSPTNCPRLHCQPNATPRVTVIFPPQHIDEQAFFHAAEPSFPKPFTLAPVELADLRKRAGNPNLSLSDALKLIGQAPSTSAPIPDTVPAQAVMAGESKLVFEIDLKEGSIPFTLEHLLDWSKWKPKVHQVARTSSQPGDEGLLLPGNLSEMDSVTSIELPYRLFLSPNEKSAWAHSKSPVASEKSTAVELWHTRLGVSVGEGQPDEGNQIDRTARAVYTPDHNPTNANFDEHNASDPRYSLDARDRQELVHLTSDFQIKTPDLYNPLPIQLDHLMLTSLGGYLKSQGRWNPPMLNPKRVLTVEEWNHTATLGRDHYVRVVYKGYLAPFAHRASLIKVTERKIASVGGTYYAILHQRLYIVVQTPRRDFPLLAQPNAGRDFPFRRIDALTLLTPDLDAPKSQSLFCPMVGSMPFLFRFRFWDMDNRVSEASLPVLFGDAQQSQTIANCTAMVDAYNNATVSGVAIPNLNCTPFDNQPVAFAPTPNPGDTRYDASEMCWRINPQNVDANNDVTLYRQNLPLFYPTLKRAKVTSASIKRITGDATAVWTTFYPVYVKNGFDPKFNRGEVILEVDDSTLPALRFGAAGKTDQAGGLSSPDTLVVGFSRKSGAVGGTTPRNAGGTTLETWSKGTFNPADFFGAFASAKLLGAVKLSDIILPLLGGLDSNLGKAPRMVEQELFDLEKLAEETEDEAVEAIRILQKPVAGNPLPNHLSPQAQTVYAAQNARNSQAKDNPFAVAFAHAGLIQAIIAYGSALDALLHDPAALISESALSLIQQLISAPGFKNLITAAQAQAAALATALESALLAAIGDMEKQFFAVLRSAQNVLVQDALKLESVAADGFSKAEVELQRLAPEIFALLDLEKTVQDLVGNINGVKSAAIDANLAGVVQRLGAIGDDLLKVQQSLGVLGVAVPSPSIVKAAKDIQRDFIRVWDTGKTVKDNLGAAMESLHAACIVLAAHPIPPPSPAVPNPGDFNYAAATQVLQNLRQIERSLEQLDLLRSTYPELGKFLNNTATLADDQAHRWLQRLQELQRQVVESANALQKIATDALQSPDGALVEAAANLLVLIVAPSGVPSLVEQVTAFLNLAKTAGQTIEVLIKPILDASPQIKSYLGVQLDSIQADLAAARTKLTTAIGGQGPADLAALYAAVLAAAAADVNTGATATQRQAAHAAVVAAAKKMVTDGIVNQLSQLAAARLQVWELSIRYQNAVASIVSWSLYFASRVAGSALQAVAKVAQATEGLANVVAGALRNLSAAGAALNAFVADPSNAPLNVLLAGSCGPLAALPAPPDGTPIGALLADMRLVMAAVSTAIQEIQNRGRDIAADLRSLANINTLKDLIAKLPIPTKISHSFDWKPDIKSFEPVFLLEKGAEFIVSAKFEVDVLKPSEPAYDTTASLNNFSINLIGSPSFVVVKVAKIVFTAANGNKPDCRLTIDKVGFGKDLAFVQDFAKLLSPQNGPFIEFAGLGVRAGFRFNVPSLTFGAFNLMQLAFEVAVQLSFNGDPLRCQFGISDQTHPFLLSAGIFGGGGFFQLQLGLDGVELLQGALEFGIVAAISIGPLNGSGYVVAGIYMAIAGNNSKVSGFVHAHGHMDIFGLISLDVDVYVGISYSNGNVEGVATFTVSVHILFFSESFSLEAHYGFPGSKGSGSLDARGSTLPLLDGASEVAELVHLRDSETTADSYDMGQEEWAEYYNAFAA